MIFIFGAAIFLSAVLLFLIQPMAAKLVLPILGGTPNVWNTAMVFFQTMLLLGYFYSHVVTRKLRLPAQFGVHALLMGLVLLALPIGLSRVAWISGNTFTPSTWLLVALTLIAGLPYFAVATTGPLLQAWFGATDDKRANDPYFLYAASNAGSLLGLLCFPFLVEPNFVLAGQSEVWTVGYALLAILVLAAGARALRRRRSEMNVVATDVPRDPMTWRRRFLWIGLAAAPSAMSLGTTTTITLDIAAVPLLWILPLSVYLLSYIFAFSSRFKVSAVAAGRFAVFGVLLVVVESTLNWRLNLPLVIGAHLLALGACGYACHRRLYELRPASDRLTEFYLCAALGGAAGGAFVALLAPQIFNALYEYPLAMAACLFLVAPTPAALKRPWWKHAIAAAICVAIIAVTAFYLIPLVAPAREKEWTRGVVLAFLAVLVVVLRPAANYRFAVVLIAIFVIDVAQFRSARGLLFADRSFFGTYEIFQTGTRNRIMHGTTLHGEQFRRPELHRIANSYYAELGPLGDIFRLLRASKPHLKIAVVGLGAGTIAAYGEKGDSITFFEIDPLVETIASDKKLFTFLSDARERGADVNVVIGDGRLGIASSKQSFDLIILDAFSSDSVPVHMLTREALTIFADHLNPGGVIAFHVTNRYFDLMLLAAQLAHANEMFSAARPDQMSEPNAANWRSRSDWVAVAASMDTLIPLSKHPEWMQVEVDPTHRVWTDSYSSLFDVYWK